MNKRNLRTLQIYVAVILIINLFLVATQVEWSNLSRNPNLDFSKDFANEIVLAMQELAAELGVTERATVKQALAKLHYDVYLAANSRDLARVIQNTASDTRDIIVLEYVNISAEHVLKVLNDDPGVREAIENTVIHVEPLLEGGYRVVEPNGFDPNTITELSKLDTLFSIETFRENYDGYLALCSLQIEIEQGSARRAAPVNDQDTIKYWEREIQNMRTEYARITKLAGMAEAVGPGISVLLYDHFPLQARDLRIIVSEFYSAGATALSINGHRLAINSYIIDNESGISVDGIIINTNPVEILALGDPQILHSGVDLLFNVVFKDEYYSELQSHENLILPGKVIQ